MKVIFEYGGPTPHKGNGRKSLIQLEQHRGRFVLVYGLKTRDGLDSTEAAHELGECILHYLDREGLVNLD